MSKLTEALNEAKKEPKKMLPKLHTLDDSIEKFIQELEGKINAVKDNPVFVRKAHQLLGDMSKEYSEFMFALRAIVNAVDRKGMVLPKEKPMGKVRDVNSNKGGPDELPPEDGGEEDEGQAPPPKGVKEALLLGEALLEKKYTLKDIPKEFMEDPLYKAVFVAKDKKSYDKALKTLLSIRGRSAIDALKNAMGKK